MGELTGANPDDRGKAGSKYHPLIDDSGILLAVGLSAANTHDALEGKIETIVGLDKAHGLR